MEKSQFLQVMRFVAAALVLCTHATFYYHERVSADLAVWHFGEVGVPIFFVISGIVMVLSAQALEPGPPGAKAFILRRIVRIVPLWWFAVSIKVAVALAHPDVVNHNHFQLDYAIKSYLFIPYFNELHAVVPLHGVGWTLLHEVFFYLLFSLALLLRRHPAAWTSFVIIGLWGLGQFVHFDNPFWVVASHSANLQFVIGMATGSLLLASARRPAWRTWAAGALVVLAAGLQMAHLHWGAHYMYPVLALTAAGTLALGSREWRGARPLEKLGDSSYSLYLFHPFIAPAAVIVLSRLAPGMDVALHLAVVVVFTIATAHVLHLIVEAPLVNWAKHRLLGGPRPGARPPLART